MRAFLSQIWFDGSFMVNYHLITFVILQYGTAKSELQRITVKSYEAS